MMERAPAVQSMAERRKPRPVLAFAMFISMLMVVEECLVYEVASGLGRRGSCGGTYVSRR